MHADHATGMSETRCELRDRQRRRVGCYDTVGRDDVLEARIELALGRGVLDDRLDHEPGNTRVGQRDHTRDPADRAIGVLLLKLALGGQFAQDVSAMPFFAASAAPKRASCSWTRWPARAATCAIPAPMAPAPMTATVEVAGNAAGIANVELSVR